ncbi:hypothetical protein QBC35DRAFT_296799 [Podospora australis]|uniref:Heterokaryon incompatibility domain-containing protein n=1 Tax=Podospora australis TaxID=1536484 RepID=A0AAN6WPJ2_9PEZI|nr:hypothetical protein QBC35DRAFT_296799 [Podospora australis]
MTSNSYPYKPIDVVGGEIRIFVPLPTKKSHEDAPIVGRLETVQLSTNPDYDALPTTWAEPEKTTEIRLGKISSRIDQNAETILRCVCTSSQPRAVWIESLCVNHADKGEATNHRAQRQRIYSQARQTIVCLDLPAASATLLDFATPEIIQALVYSKNPVLFYRSEEMALCSHDQNVPVISTQFDNFFKTTAANPREDLRDRINKYTTYLEGAGIILPLRELTTATRAQISAEFTRKLVQHTGGNLDILNYREPRDRYPSSDTILELPSWVPNFAAERIPQTPTPLLNWPAADSNYGATSLLTAHIREDDKPDTLTLSGIRFDEISELGEPWHPEPDKPPISRSGIKVLEEWETLALAPSPAHCPSPYGGESTRKEALWRTYIADYARYPAPKEGGAFIECWYDRVGWSSDLDTAKTAVDEHLKTLLLPKPSPRSWLSPLTHHLRRLGSVLGVSVDNTGLLGPKEQYIAYARRIYTACAHRRFFMTKRGFIGLAPSNAGKGDVVAVLQGGKTPFLLRPRQVHMGTYELVGECFVYGLMNQEALGWEHAIVAAREFRTV